MRMPNITQLYGRACIAESRQALSFDAFRRLVAVVHLHGDLLTIVANVDWMHPAGGRPRRREVDGVR
jgi:hypothetical protein